MSVVAIGAVLQALVSILPRALVPGAFLPSPDTLLPRRLLGEETTPSGKADLSRIWESDLNSLDTSNATDSLTTRCYGIFGCFSIDQPFLSLARPINAFPLPVDLIMPNFCLYTRDSPELCQLLKVSDPISIRASSIRLEAPVKILTHGYLEHGDKRWLKNMKEEYLLYDDLNVVVVDWLSGSGPPYTQAVANIRLIGAIIGRLVLDLEEYFGVPPSAVHVVGHSLGAQLGGYAGEYLKSRGAKLGRITGLDPAEPYFEGTDPVVRLDPLDATLVDVIHTDAGPIITGGLGLQQPAGHFDFYPNGGIRMPGCGAHFLESVAKEQGNIPYGLRRFIGCNHIRSYEYFTESINSACPFMAIECPSWEAYWKGLCWECGPDWHRCARMGAHADSYMNYSQPDVPLKVMYLITAPDPPFCTFHHRVSVMMSFTAEARKHGGDIGVFYITFYGDHGVSDRIQLNLEEIYFEPGNAYTYMIGTKDLGRLHYAILEWTYVTAYYNPLTWRILSQPLVYVNRVHIDSVEMQERYEFCGLDLPFRSGTHRKLEWQAGCPEPAPPPGASILGTIINFDVEDTITDNINAVNSGLNSLGNGQFINNLASSANQVARELMEGLRRRRVGGGPAPGRRKKGRERRKGGARVKGKRRKEDSGLRWRIVDI
ncbi:pancreatic triacylglycerol lipase-like isoform X1 [Penaeus chinensis]|uniref:pancreatic triacylglycerol lipase-like isoform X1 n=1 Tax=Penaeus chinensis TaxID=139456 RepID=UPI001FB7486C|nr:pancreatic triacylglycerol lipase-like isoform X1 [Penaeus chinensis]